MIRAGEGGALTGRGRWPLRVRQDAHARVWIEKGMEYARTLVRGNDTERERRIVTFECVCEAWCERKRGAEKHGIAGYIQHGAEWRCGRCGRCGNDRDTKRQIGSRPAKFLRPIN